MARLIKKFATTAEFNAWKNSEDCQRPYVCLTTDTGNVYYDNTIDASDYSVTIKVSNDQGSDFDGSLHIYKSTDGATFSVFLNGEKIYNDVDGIKSYYVCHGDTIKYVFQGNRIPAYAFHGLAFPIEEVVIGDGIQTIGDYAFARDSIEKVVIGKMVREIRPCAFLNSCIEKVVMPYTNHSNTLSIQNSAFAKNRFKSIIVPDKSLDLTPSIFSGNQCEYIRFLGRLPEMEFRRYYNLKRLKANGGEIDLNNFTNCYALTPSSFEGIDVNDSDLTTRDQYRLHGLLRYWENK